MSEPECNHSQVHATSQQVHGGRVSQRMRCDFFRLERRTGRARGCGVTCNEQLQCVGAKMPTPRTREYGGTGFARLS